MAETSGFSEALQFLDKLGIYDVVLPFILVFTVVFAILEKSKVFGTIEIDGVDYPQKNLNSLFAFVTAFLVVASTRIVRAINEALANVVLVLLMAVAFLLLAGTFHTGKEEFKLEGMYKGLFVGIMFASVILIFLHAIKTKDGKPWLFVGWEFIVNNYHEGAVSALLLTLALIGFMMYITKDPSSGKKKKEDD